MDGSQAESPNPALLERTSQLIGGNRVVGHRLKSALDIHDAVEAGFPGSAVSPVSTSTRRSKKRWA